jgi:hypothetical protein
MRRLNTDSAPNKLVTLLRNQLLIRCVVTSPVHTATMRCYGTRKRYKCVRTLKHTHYYRHEVSIATEFSFRNVVCVCVYIYIYILCVCVCVLRRWKNSSYLTVVCYKLLLCQEISWCSRMMMLKWAEHVACMEAMLYVYRILFGAVWTDGTTWKP